MLQEEEAMDNVTEHVSLTEKNPSICSDEGDLESAFHCVSLTSEHNPSNTSMSSANTSIADTEATSHSETTSILSEINPSMSSANTSIADTGLHSLKHDKEMAERMEKIIKIEPMTKSLVRYFKPDEIANIVYDGEEDEKLEILKDSFCDQDEGMRSLLEQLVDSGGQTLMKFYKHITTLDEDTGYIPLVFLRRKDVVNQEKVSNLVKLIVEIVESTNIANLTATDLKRILDDMVIADFMKKPVSNIESQNPTDGLMSILKLLKRGKPEWPFHLLKTLQAVRPDLFGSREGHNEETSIGACDQQQLSQLQRKPSRIRNLRKLGIIPKDVNADCLKIMIGTSALDEEQLDPKERKVPESETKAWNLRQSSDSDEDIDDGEETERKVVVTDSSSSEVNLKLREYQKELAETALKGKNTIICAPTGCGKTRVAMEIMIKHLKERQGYLKKPPKVCFFTRTVPLAVQQYNTISKTLPSNFKANIFTGDSEYSVEMHLMLPRLDVVVLTPMILQNHIKKGNIKDLSIFSLLIFDECHHTREGEAYNILMSSFLDQKLKRECDLPQVVGLTASFPVEKAINAYGAAESIIRLCANLDASTISVVVNNKVELDKKVAVPTEVYVHLEDRDQDESFEMIRDAMEKLEEEAQHCAQEIKDEKMIHLLQKIPPNKKLQRYNNWAVDLLKEAEKLPRTEKETHMSVRLLMVIAKYLAKYHFALETHDLVHLQDVMNYLEDCFDEIRGEEVMPVGETRLYDYFRDLKDSMQQLHHDVNPNLMHLMNVIEEYLLKKGSSSRGIIFVRTRGIAEALVSWLNRCSNPEIRNLKARIFTGTNAKESQGGMTMSQQNALVGKFRDGKVRVLVATSVAEEGMDVPECNLVIKYNHVGNEITTIQTRGRSRKKGGYSILMAMKSIYDKETLNRERTKLMYEGIEIVREMKTDDFMTEVLKIQKKDAEYREIQAMVAADEREEWKDCKFKMYCKLCRKFCIESKDIRLVCENFRIVVNRDVWDHKKVYPCKPKYIDETQIVGSVRCVADVQGRKCNGALGALVYFNKVLFLALGVKNFMFEVEEEGQGRPLAVKKWKDIPYPFDNLSSEDIINYLQKPENKIPFGVQETLSVDPVYRPSIQNISSVDAESASEHSQSSDNGLISGQTREMFDRYHPQAFEEGDTMISSYSSSASHHETKRKEYMDETEMDSGVSPSSAFDSSP